MLAVYLPVCNPCTELSDSLVVGVEFQFNSIQFFIAHISRYTYKQSNIVSMRYKVISEKAHVVEHCIKIIMYNRVKAIINK